MAKNEHEKGHNDEGSEPEDRQEAEQRESASPGSIPPIDFTTFILSLSTQAIMQLGDAPTSEGKGQAELIMARQTIDLLGLLEHKTKGNLTGEEERLLQQILFDLRMRYISKTKEQDRG